MKTFIFILTIPLIMFLFGSLSAQGRGPGMGGGGQNPEYMAQKQTDMMTEQLGLAKDQIPKVYQINLETAKKMIAFRDANRGNRTAMQQKMQQLQKEKEPALKELLTKGQYEKLLELRKENSGGYGPGYGRN